MKTKLITVLLCAASLPAAQFRVTVDTTAINNQTGTIDIQFNPNASPPYESGVATITAFNLGAGSFGPIFSGPDGGASGTLPGPLVLINSNFLNGIGYNAIFGRTASFFVDFSGNAFTASGQSILTSLIVSLSGATTIGAVADLLGDSRIDTSFSSPGVAFAPVPEPSTFGLIALGLAACAPATRRRR